ncbi:hypothetical protein COCMIDRAFT_106685 [Bipolaris oryzae ATCC 44560]|uniref:Uncharacterized protein n=1 Tax=Bipolaris oryzae ATCC 44560 TaxID=930090 RepID=W6Z0N0_COCMI|nr:uncharacterized protein COCMIDRAFT_106685 [Bipolaris oryzae ATCC 44560]EUC41229.1 hypothetical protein COCMIDRAFT_106685 [Bipolaris oryzae ATCC 44560]
MRSYVAVSIFAFSASVLSAPTPQLGLNNLVGSVTGTATGTVGSLTGTVGKTVDPVTGVVSKDGSLEGVTGLLKEKRQLEVLGGLTRPATDLTKPVTDIVGDVTKIRVVGNARRQLDLPVVPKLTETVDRVTDSVNLSGTVKGLTETVDRVTDSVNLSGTVKGVNADLHNKRELLNLDTTTSTVDGLTGLNSNELTADVTHGQILDTDKVLDLNTDDLLDIDLNLKRGIPVVQDLPVGGGVSGILDNTPVVGGLTNTVNSVTGDLDPVTGLVYKTAKPVTDATNILDVRAPLLDNVEVEHLVGVVNVPAVGDIVKNVPAVKDV